MKEKLDNILLAILVVIFVSVFGILGYLVVSDIFFSTPSTGQRIFYMHWDKCVINKVDTGPCDFESIL